MPVVPTFPEPKHESKGPLRKVNSKTEHKGEYKARQYASYSPLVGPPGGGGIQRVSLSRPASFFSLWPVTSQLPRPKSMPICTWPCGL